MMGHMVRTRDSDHKGKGQKRNVRGPSFPCFIFLLEGSLASDRSATFGKAEIPELGGPPDYG